jgi:hypothetical protein
VVETAQGAQSSGLVLARMDRFLKWRALHPYEPSQPAQPSCSIIVEHSLSVVSAFHRSLMMLVCGTDGGFLPTAAPSIETARALVESGDCAVGAFPRMRAWIETAAPLPWFVIVRVADAPNNGPDVDVAIVDVPAVLALGISGG